MTNILIKNARVIDPENKIDGVLDILIKDGKIVEVGKNINPACAKNARRDPAEPEGRMREQNGAEIIDAAGKIAAPGFIDMHTHLRQPGKEDEETFLTASKAAAKGGFTTIVAMPNTSPVCDNQGVVEYVMSEGRKINLVNIYAAGSVTKNIEGKDLSEIGDMVKAGVLAVTDDGRPVWSSHVMRRALEYTKMFGIPVIDHCEDLELSKEGVMNEGFISTKLGLKGIPNEAEYSIVARDIALLKLSGGKLHIAHVSAKESVELIRQAKKEKLNITCEAVPHHFTLTDEAIKEYNTYAKVNPPLRAKEDIEALKQGIKDGTIDVIATDHAPHLEIEKDVEFNFASFGMIGLQSALPLALMELVDKKYISLNQLIEKMSANPAKILGLKNKGSLSAGKDADVVLFDPNSEWVYDEKTIESKSKNTPFLDWKLKGKVTDLIVGGRLILKSGNF